MMKKNNKGFTLIELLVVIAIIGLLSTLAVVALGNARQKARDAKRLSDLKQMQTALELYYTDKTDYPAAAAPLTLGAAADSACLDGTGFTTVALCASPYMGQVPADPLPAQNYVYTKGANTYTITATLETTMNGLSGGVTLSPSGIAD